MMRANELVISLALCAMCVACGLNAAAPQAGVRGVVVDERGAPVADAQVWSDPQAAPDRPPVRGKAWSTKTSADGSFTLEGNGAMIHFSAEKYEPLVVRVMGAGSRTYVLKDAANDFVLPKCGPVPAGQRSFGEDNFRFTADTRPFKVLGGKSDTDYVEWVLQAKGAKIGLELWFGPYAMTMLPDDEQFVSADSFSMRNIILEGRGAVGIDSRGTTRGKQWRHFAIVGEGVRYENADYEQAKLFDAVIESACGSPADAK
jgi:hypothetical protein